MTEIQSSEGRSVLQVIFLQKLHVFTFPAPDNNLNECFIAGHIDDFITYVIRQGLSPVYKQFDWLFWVCFFIWVYR